jgi:hypothetical protein
MYGAGGATPALMDLARPYWQRMMAARDAMATGKLQFKAFLAPAFDLIDSYMNFEIQGNTAAPILTLLLSLQLNLPTMGSPDTTPPEGRASAVEHLVSVATSMVRERAEVQVTPFFELSYLANLYFMSAFELGQQADESGGLAQDRLRTIEDRVFVGEERRAQNRSRTSATGARTSLGTHPDYETHLRNSSACSPCARRMWRLHSARLVAVWQNGRSRTHPRERSSRAQRRPVGRARRNSGPEPDRSTGEAHRRFDVGHATDRPAPLRACLHQLDSGRTPCHRVTSRVTRSRRSKTHR